MIILGAILLIIGFVTGAAIISTIGIIVVIAGAILAPLGFAGHAVGGTAHGPCWRGAAQESSNPRKRHGAFR